VLNFSILTSQEQTIRWWNRNLHEMRMFKLSIPAKIVNNRNLPILVILWGLFLPYFGPLRTQLLPILFHPSFHSNTHNSKQPTTKTCKKFKLASTTSQKLAKNSNFIPQLHQKLKRVCEFSSTIQKKQDLTTLLIWWKMFNCKKGGNKKQ